jgi:tellurite resistance protein TehA-like permease
MTSAHILLPQASAASFTADLLVDSSRRHTLRPSWFLWGATAAFVAVAAGSVLHCVSAYAGLFSGVHSGVDRDCRAGHCGLER